MPTENELEVVSQQTEQGFGTGAKPQPYDVRDHAFVAGAGPFDWNIGYSLEQELVGMWNKPFVLPISNQNGSLSCVGQAWTKYSSVKQYVEKGIWVDESAHDLYYRIHLPSGGAYIRDGGMKLINEGVVTEKDLSSYQNGNPPSETYMRTAPALADAVYLKIRDALQLKEIQGVVASIESFAKAMSLNHGLILGVNGSNNGTWFSAFPTPPSFAEWGHALFACRAKMINGKKYIGVANSWGGQVGENGFQWLGEEWFMTGNIFDGWTATDEPNHVANETEYEKIDAIITDPNHQYPDPNHSPYVEVNWNHVLQITGVTGITWGMYYDYAQYKKRKALYEI